MKRLIFHVDVNSAFLSWEAARRVALGMDDIRLIPSAVAGSKDRRTSIILAKSIPAKQFGITTGEPVSMALRKCPGLLLADPDFKIYIRNSEAFMNICREYAPVLEKYSIDECFLDMSNTMKIYPDPIVLAHTIKDRIKNELGFTVNIGLGENKLCAKMASDFEKPDKVHTLFMNEISAKMWPLPVGELFTLGKAAADRLMKANIRTIGELACSDPVRIRKLLGDKTGLALYEYANGRENSEVRSKRDAAKGFSIATTLEEDVLSASQAHRILSSLAENVALHMRMENARCTCVGVNIRSNDFKNRSHQKRLNSPTDITEEICRTAFGLFDELWDKNTPLRLLGISLTGITYDTYEQMELFTDKKKEKARKLDKALDSLRARYGVDVISKGAHEDDGRIGQKYRAKFTVQDTESD